MTQSNNQENKKPIKKSYIIASITLIFIAGILAVAFTSWATIVNQISYENAITERTEQIQEYRDYENVINMPLAKYDGEHYFSIDGISGTGKTIWGNGRITMQSTVQCMAYNDESSSYELFDRYYSDTKIVNTENNEDPYVSFVYKKNDDGYEYESEMILHVPVNNVLQ